MIAHPNAISPGTLTIGKDAQVCRTSLWRKLSRCARAAGRQVVEKALLLYYAAESPTMPAWARATAFGALAWFILPADAVPDLLPGAGFADDLGALAAALLLVMAHITPEVRAKANAAMSRWFGAP